MEGQEVVLRIKDWARHYENNRTREMKRMSWVPIRNRLDSDGYVELLDHVDGAAHFGCWIACVEVASNCHPRGDLLRDSRTPHDVASLARLTRIPAKLLQVAIRRLLAIGWLEESEPPAGILRESRTLAAPIPQESALSGRKEGRKEGKEPAEEPRTPQTAGVSEPPPAAGRNGKHRKERKPVPPEVAATLERLRGLREGASS